MTFITKISTTTALALSLTLSLVATEAPVSTPASLLSYVDTKAATGDVKAVYDEVTAAWGFVPIVLKQYSVNPKLLRTQWELYKELANNKSFDQKMLAMLRMVLGESQECTYCVGLNKGMLLNMFKVPMNELTAISKNPSTAKLDKKQKAMFLYVIKAVKTPHHTTKTDIESLRKLGWSDKDIFEGVKSGTNVIAATTLIDALKLQRDF